MISTHDRAILRDLAEKYPNITAIRVRDAIDRVADALAGLAAATSYGAAATLLTGFLVLVGAAASGTPARIYEAAILKTLGASRRAILSSFLIRSAILGLGAGLVAIVAGGLAASTLAGMLFALRPLNARASIVLRATE